ncbi:MAG: hypothetical protein ACXVHB_22940 [Solirubrobacteraceae bacterium]
MNATIVAREIKTEGLRGDLRPSERSPRPIHHPETGGDSGFGGGR